MEQRVEDAAAAPGEPPVAELIAARDWSATPIGPRESWPQSLRTALSICLDSRFPILIWWGPEHVMLYNEPYAAVIGSKHPDALGQPGAECFPEIWEIIGPMLAGVLERGEATWSDDQLLVLERKGFPEECYFTFSYSPIRDESGGIGGVFTAVAETTGHVIGARRLGILRELAAATAEARTADDVCARAATVLDGSLSVAFSLTYLFDGEGGAPRLAAATEIADPDAAAWPLAEIAAGAEAVMLERLDEGLPCRRAIALPLAHGTTEPRGAVVLGFNDRRPADDDYVSFMRLVAGQIAAAVGDAAAYEEERRRADALAELDRAKTLFFTNVSHELRTPLTLILSPLEDLLARPEPPARGELRDQLGLVQRNALRLLRLVNTLLDFSRAESGRIDALFQPTDLAATTADLASSFRSAVESAGLRLEVDCPPLAEPVWVDREAWEKIVLNLLSNALKFTFDGAIEVSLHADADAAVLQVRDSGVGIPAEELPHLFERFHRVRDVRARTHEGSGVGLALVRELAELHGGAAEAESAPGAGTTFTVRLPLGSAHLPAERLGGPEGTAARGLGAAPYVEEALRWLPGEHVVESDEEAALRDDLVRETGLPRSRDARILVADDNADVRGYVARLLRRYWQVETVPDGAAALAAARSDPPDLVLSDVMMPGLDGFELLHALRSDPATSTVPVVLLSARAGAESAVEGLEAGADDYLVKPFSARELVARVRANLELARLRVELAQLEAVAEERARAEQVLVTLPDGVFIVGAAGTIELWSPAAERITGLPAAAAVGHRPAEALPGFDELAARLAGRHGRTTTHPFELDGRELWLSVVSAPYPDGALYGFRDATEGAVLEQLRRDLVTTVSHELRTPVSSVYGAAATLARDDLDLDEAVRRQLTETLHEQTQRLARIVDQLATVAALDDAAASGERRPCDVVAVAARALDRAELRRPDGVAVRGRLPEEELLLELDEEQLEQVLDALLDNALRFTPAGEVELSVEAGDDVVRIRVRDTGIGIAPEHHGRIGEKFFRVDPQLAGGVAGLGLGLYVCRRLLWLMGGRLAFDSVEGAGSTFVAELPAR